MAAPQADHFNRHVDAVKRRQEATPKVLADSVSIVSARKPRYLFSGVTTCGVCVLKPNHVDCYVFCS